MRHLRAIVGTNGRIVAREYELRLTVAPEAAEHVVSHRLIRSALRHRQVGQMTSTYFDTPDSKLHRHRFGLRVRRDGNNVTHTLKRSGGSLVDRGEWERADASQNPNMLWLRETPLAPFLSDGSIAAALGPRFTVEVTRTTLSLEHKRSTIEVALDQGTILSDGFALPLSELELEIKGGRNGAALHLARELARELPLTLSLASKAERGYSVGDLTWGRPSATITPRLTKRMTLAQAFEAILQACLSTFLKNVALIQNERDGDAVHKSRIALRHLRAACQLFRPVLRRKRLKALRRNMRWLSNRLGRARDADVFRDEVFEPAAQRNDVIGAKALAQMMGDRRMHAHHRLRKALASPRARLLYIDLLAFSENGIRRKRRNRRFRPFVRAALGERRSELASRARGLIKQTPGEVHEVRKAAKMLRYDLDLLAEAPKVMRPQTRRKLGGRLKTLQKCLGEIQDQEAVRDHLRTTVLAKRRRLSTVRAELRPAFVAAAHIAASPIDRDAALREAAKAARHL